MRTSIEELVQAEKISPIDADIYYLRGKIYAAANRYRDAADVLRRAIALRPTDYSFYYQLGLAYQRLGEHSLAREQFDRMEHLKPRSSLQ